MIGAIVGLAVVAFILLTENLGSRLYPAGGSPWRRALIPIAGSLGTGFLLYRYFPDARGSGIPQTKIALFLREGYISLRTVLGRFGLCSASLASGIALGREGPSVQVGAGIASVLGRKLGLSQARVKSLLPVGASAALAAAFNTPIAAVLFSLEEVMGDMHAPVLGSIVLSSATSWMVLHLILGDEPLFHVPAYQLVHPAEFAIYAVLGAVGGAVSAGFVKLLLWQRKYFLRFPRRFAWAYPAAGGLLVGVLGWFVPDVLGVGYGSVGKALNGQLALGTMALLILLKGAATTTCYASGNAGGIFGPTLFLGAMLGGAGGGIAHSLLPDYTGSAGAYALVGMGAMFAGVIRVPLTSVIMIFETTRDYSIIVPLMIANLVAYVISSRLQPEPVYEALQHQDGVHLPESSRSWELLTVSQGMLKDPDVLDADLTIAQAAARAGSAEWWPVLKDKRLVGILASAEIAQAAATGRGSERVASLANSSGRLVHVHPDHPLDTALQRMARSGMSVLPVVSRTDVGQLLATISRERAVAAYESEGAEPAEAVIAVERRSLKLMVRTAAALAVMAFAGAMLAYTYRSSRTSQARQYYREGEQLIEAGRPGEAVEQFRHALSISHSTTDRQALGLALVEAARFEEAAIYLDDVLRADSASGPANLGMARVRASEKRIDESARYYRRAANGRWRQDEGANRYQAELELVDMLAKAGRQASAQAELQLVAAEAPGDLARKRTVAAKMAELGMSRETAAMWREVVAGSPADREAWVALGRAQAGLGQYREARVSFQHAAQLGAALPAEAGLTDRILEMDPEERGLNSRERYRRSREILAAAIGVVSGCGAEGPALEEARAALSAKGAPKSYGDAASRDINLAEEVWKLRGAGCRGDPALEILLPRLGS